MKKKNTSWTKQHTIFSDLSEEYKVKGMLSLTYLYLGILFVVILYFESVLSDLPLTLSLLLYFSFAVGFALDVIAIFSNFIRRNYTLLSILIGITIWCLVFITMRYAEKVSGDNSFDFTSYICFFLAIIFISFGLSKYGQIIRVSVEERFRISSEIKFARKIQSQIIPDINYSDTHIELTGKTENAKEVGGDYFDFVKLPGNKIAVMIGDVSGHNLAAGVLMAFTKSAVRTELKYNSDTVSVINSLNNTLCENSGKNMFVTFFLLILDLDNKKYEFINAGHIPVIKLSGTDITNLNNKNIALGIKPDFKFTSSTGDFKSGNRFYFLTDGILERMDSKKEEFGYNRIEKEIIETENLSLESGFNRIIDKIKSFSAGELQDDATLMILEIKS
ncbi:MAG: serine/threonine-protein phosphatase [Ignavibacteria bacterium]|nr:serine/threonine-protein phosphatase [Ignavibacteria bacterium]